MKNETDVIKIRIDSDVKPELEKIAESEQRTFAGQIRLALSEWLETKSARPGRGSAAGQGEAAKTATNTASVPVKDLGSIDFNDGLD